MTLDPDTVTIVRYWVRRRLPRSDLRSLVITRQRRRLLASLFTDSGDQLVWARYLGRHRHQWQALNPKAGCKSCEQEWTTLQDLARDLGVPVESH